MKRVFKYKKGELSEDLVDNPMTDFLLDYLLDYGERGSFPKFRDNFKVTIIIERRKI